VRKTSHTKPATASRPRLIPELDFVDLVKRCSESAARES
jgi:hypothetical protein